MKKLIYSLLFALVGLSCEPTVEAEFTDRPVVCCYLVAGECPTLTVQKLIPFQSDAVFSDEDVNALNITITDTTTSTPYQLTLVADGTYTNQSLVVESGHNYHLQFLYDGVAVEAQTSVPAAIQDVRFSSTTIGVMSFGPMAASRAPQGGGNIEISWQNEEGDYYIVEGQTTSTSPIREVEEGDDMPSQSFKLNYTQGSSATLSSSDFAYFGAYKISVLHIQPEYAVLSQGGSTSSATLEDVRGNIEGGYGIFTGVSSVTKVVNVVEQSSPF